MDGMSDWYDKQELPHQFQVDDTPSRFTGILDANGHKIYASPEPIGFVTTFPKPRIRIKAGRQPY
jgi:hypothetical protein